jgi:glutathione S-transferase
MTASRLALYGAPCSLYTAKARACLRKNGIPFDERFQSHPRYKQHVLPTARNHRIPVMEREDGTIIQDSTLIIDDLETRFPAIPRTTGALRVVDLFIEAFADRSLLKAAMHYRWNFPDENLAFIRGEFGRILRYADQAQWDSAGMSIAGRMSSYLPPLGITPESIPAIEGAYLKLLDALNAHFFHYPYLLGNAPSRADYGLMGPLYAHLGRDPYPVRIMLQRAPLVFRWVERMNASERHSPEFPDTDDSVVDAGALPATLVDVLGRVAIEYVPEFQATMAAFEKWNASKAQLPAGTPVSEKGDQPSFGMIAYDLEGRTIHQASGGHTLWMNQRVTDTFAALQHDEKAKAEAIFARIGASPVLSLQAPRRLSRLQNTLSLA